MENYNPTQYSFSQLYLRILPEGRIRRRQYMIRMVIGGIVLGLIYVALMRILWHTPMMTSVVLWILHTILVSVAFFMWYVLNTKRIQDIGKDSRIVQKITLSLFIWYVVYYLYSTLGENGWIAGYSSSLQQALSELNGIFNEGSGSAISSVPWHQILMEYSIYPYVIILIGLFFYLLLIPGDNEYGNDPTGSKLGFFG